MHCPPLRAYLLFTPEPMLPLSVPHTIFGSPQSPCSTSPTYMVPKRTPLSDLLLLSLDLSLDLLLCQLLRQFVSINIIQGSSYQATAHHPPEGRGHLLQQFWPRNTNTRDRPVSCEELQECVEMRMIKGAMDTDSRSSQMTNLALGLLLELVPVVLICHDPRRVTRMI